MRDENEAWLRCYGHILQMDEENKVKQTMSKNEEDGQHQSCHEQVRFGGGRCPRQEKKREEWYRTLTWHPSWTMEENMKKEKTSGLGYLMIPSNNIAA